MSMVGSVKQISVSCTGFADSKTKNKHYKKHVEGKPAGGYGSGDMLHRFDSANAYQQAAINFMNLSSQPFQETFHSIVEGQTDKGNLYRWNVRTNEYAVMTLLGVLKTYHLRDTEHFLLGLQND